MKDRITKFSKAAAGIVKTETFRDSGVVFGGNMISAVLGAVFFFLLAHKLGAGGFGIFNVVIAVMITSVDLFDIAINNAMVNFGTKIGQRGWVLRNGLKRKLLLAIILSSAIWAGRDAIVFILGRPELKIPLEIGISLILAKSLYSFVRTSLQITKKFYLDAIVDILTSVFRIGLFYGLALWGIDGLKAGLWSYSISLILPLPICIPLIWKLLSEKSDGQDKLKFDAFQSWMTVSFIFSAISSRLDVFFLTRFASLEIVGWYQAAFRLFMPIQQLASSLSRVFAPRHAAFLQDEEAANYTRKGTWLSLGLALSILLTIPLFHRIIPVFYGAGFMPAINMSYWLMPYFMFFLFFTPWWSQLLYYHSKAKTFAFLSILQLFLTLIFVPLAIWKLGVNGVGISLAGITMIVGILAILTQKGNSLWLRYIQ